MNEDFNEETALPQMGHAGLAPWHQLAWDLRAAGNFIGGGTGTGLLILAAAAAIMGKGSAILVIGGLVLVGLGLFSVFLEIGRPLRALNVLLGAKFSWMTREALVAGILFPLGAATLFYPDLAKLVWVPALAYLYCQGRILEAAKGIPTWRSPLMLPLILATGMVEGTGAFILLALLALDGGIPDWTGGVLIAALAARVFIWMLYRRRMVDKGEAPVAAGAVLIAFSGPFTIGGNVMPILFLVLAGLEPSLASAALAAAGLIALLGGWALKVVIVTKAAHNQGYAINHTPARGGGPSGPGVKPGWREIGKE